MTTAVISGDIVASTSLDDSSRTLIEDSLKNFLKILNDKFNVFGRMIKGDYLECVVPEPADALQVALAIKSYVKSIPINNALNMSRDKRYKLFKAYGIRLAIGYGNLSRYEPDKGIIDGEAIYLSGRLISDSSTYSKERNRMKNTLYFISNNVLLNKECDTLFTLLDVLLTRATSKQCEVLYLKLLGFNEEAISKRINIVQSTVNQHSRSAGWNAIDKAVRHFSEIITNQ